MIYNISKILIGIMLFLCGIKDIKSKKVSLIIVVTFMVFLVGMLPFNKEISIINGLLGSCVGICIMFISKITKGQIGIGDGLVLCATGIGLGMWDNLSILVYSLFLAAIYSIGLLSFRRANKKDTIAFVPFLFVAFIGVLIK